ncbi:HAMP domain-containing protein [Rhodocyclus tenuis]|uniref:histidine kinase n=2 Tax=Rhodocyclus TaxID=1064 RepID=A0A6L5JST0_RHOTE|nr:ATP-binding protein [Rhodocyclus gracilis]MQY50433.1 HAMP domain-containing protein [Rhodocyclus gracilis]MRD71670.1 HAMP domain-containing protein [Rhodocyclus gracilis]NJA87936.1 HAMP domain-containing protein [Rhodocyclus gracilis]
MNRLPRTLLARTFLLISLLLSIAVASWLGLFALSEKLPRAQQLAQLVVSVVNLTRAALVAAEPSRRHALLREMDEREGVRVLPVEATDRVEPPSDSRFQTRMRSIVTASLGADTRFASVVNGQRGIWVSFHLDPLPSAAPTGANTEDEFWLMLPGSRAEHDFPWHWVIWAVLVLGLALAVAWLIVSRVTEPLRALARAARELGRGQRPAALPERGSLELQQLAEAFNRMSEDLHRIDAERAETLAGISHDLRTPLARLRLDTELSVSDSVARAAMSADIEQMDTVIAQFLEFARGESEALQHDGEINMLAVEAAARARRAGISLAYFPGELPPGPLYPHALSRAIDNLLDNARKYAGGEIELHTRLDRTGERLIEVMDRGPGIPESESERLKRPFTRMENARSNAGGAGLGLAIVERIAHLHGGQLELRARPGGGLIACLRLPGVTPPDTARR